MIRPPPKSTLSPSPPLFRPRTLATPADLLRFSELKVSAEAVARRISPKDALKNLQVLEQTQRLLHTNVQEALRSEEHTSELQSPCNLVCRLLLEKKKREETA